MEKYGEIPPRFSGAWFGYIWEYYKWYLLGGAFVIILVAMFLFQCTHRVKYDMTVVYAGHMTYSEEQQAKICGKAAEYVPDIDGNEKVNIYFQPLVFSDKAGNEEYDYAIQTKLDLTFVDKYAYIYLMDEIETALYMQRDMIADIFEPVSEFAPESNAETMAGDSDGVEHAIKLSESRLLKECGIDGENLYLMVRKNTNPDDERDIKSHEGAIEFAKALAE